MRIDIFTIFPDFFKVLDVSLLGKAQTSGTLEIQTHNLRDWAEGPHRSVDDTPYGGGAGMVMRADIWLNALESVLSSLPENSSEEHASGSQQAILVPSPSGVRLTQELAQRLSTYQQLTFCCGRYEGIDARFVEALKDQEGPEVIEFSLGDYVLNGGESATVVAIEAIARLVPEVIGNQESLTEESHGESGLLEYPIYTRPAEVAGLGIPEVLKSGNHADINAWRHDRALEKTAEVRPDLLQIGGKARANLSTYDRLFLALRGYAFAIESANQAHSERLSNVTEAALKQTGGFKTTHSPVITKLIHKKKNYVLLLDHPCGDLISAFEVLEAAADIRHTLFGEGQVFVAAPQAETGATPALNALLDAGFKRASNSQRRNLRSLLSSEIPGEDLQVLELDAALMARLTPPRAAASKDLLEK
ncbi:tRNA (guanosine(37)-N1)-methyltransferase TrmD [Boudabousia liubingyangii]|uniref:tRNA (guanosine(37)-N1)-methyltransferase TrmD n=1 Tax=Boudabousia liubingyangii TaxID=1921764 RepID=UPI00093D79E5|nr:tRNA (guanosine(37)-N1)-methyltransferase TrmD [Boudabousia liubingyangii]OKL46475.1 tRNA (guanosine(37)-N1)-methyltransferase TrmD [Boudabousia liubingyangii]